MDRIGFAQLVAAYKGEKDRRAKIRFNAAFDKFEEELQGDPRPPVAEKEPKPEPVEPKPKPEKKPAKPQPEPKKDPKPMPDMPTEFVYLDDNGQPVTDSLKVAEVFGRRHDHILKKIKALKCPEDFKALHFVPGSYTDQKGEGRPMVTMTHDGFIYLVMGFTGEKGPRATMAYRAKIKFLAAFDEAEAKLKASQPEPQVQPKKDPEPMPKDIIKKPETDFVAHEEGILEAQPEALDVKDLVVLDAAGKPTTDSRKVAKVFGKRHDHVLRDIKKLIEKDVPNFGEISIPDAYGRLQPAFAMDRDGFTLLAMGFEGDKALRFKLDYIAAFNAMEETLRTQPKPMSKIKMLAAMASEMEKQEEKLLEMDAKISQADEKTKAVEEKVAEIDHAFNTNGCAKGFIPLKDARRFYGRGLSEEMFNLVMGEFDQPHTPYRYKRPDGEWGTSMSIKVDGIADIMSEFVTTVHKHSRVMCKSTLFGDKLFKIAAQEVTE